MPTPREPLAPSSVLGYATPDHRRPPGPWLRRIALFCGGLPLTVGLLDLIAWVITSHGTCVEIGLITIIFGTWIVGIGFVCAAVYAGLESRAKLPTRRWLGGLLLTCLLFASNFVGAFVSLSIVNVVPPRRTVTITNTSNVPLDAVSLFNDSQENLLGPIAPSKSVTFGWRSKSTGSSFKATFQGQAPIFGLVSDDTGDEFTGHAYDVQVQPAQFKIGGAAQSPSTQPVTPNPLRD